MSNSISSHLATPLAAQGTIRSRAELTGSGFPLYKGYGMKLSLKTAWRLCAVIVCASSLNTLAQGPKFPPYAGHVNDFANIIEAATEEQLETLLLNFERRTGAQIAVVTVASLEGRSIEEYAVDLFRSWGIGARSGKDKDKGLLLLIAPNERRSRLEIGYGLEGDLPDGLAGEILRRMRPFFKEQQWSRGISVGVQTILATLAQKWNIPLEGIDQRYAYSRQQSEEDSGISVLLFPIFVIIFWLIISRLGPRRGGYGPSSLWWLWPLIFNRSGGSFGGGSWSSGGSSWGGFGSGGASGWGGFGGGRSGGGGASDSW